MSRDPNEPNIFARIISSLSDFFVRWWREATAPIEYFQTPFRAILRRIMLWIPVAVLLAVITGAIGAQFFISWRARDLARKALANVERDNLNMARVQITSARSLRPEDPEVLRVLAAIETKIGFVGAAESWRKLPANLELTPDELELRATAMMRGGDEGQFNEALAALEKAGRAPQAGMLRAEQNLSRGDLQQAIVEARAAVKGSDLPAKRLALLQLLLARYARFLSDTSQPLSPENLAGGQEISGIVDSLLGTPKGEEAIAMALGSVPASPDEVRRWSEAVWKSPAPDNVALLPAATAMIASGQAKRDELLNRLKAVYAGADPARKAALASWLIAQGDTDGALVYATPAEATRNAQAFVVRAQALEQQEKWNDLLALAEGAGNVPRSLTLAAAAQANGKLGRTAQAQRSAQDAVRAAAREGTIVVSLGVLDRGGFRKTADAEVIALCGEAETAERMFVIARDRFARGGQPASLQSAYERAAAASPNSPVIADYQRYNKMISGTPVNPQETAAALAANPSDLNLRFTHALALLQAGKAKESLAVFEDFDVFVDQLPPGQKALVVAIFAANGEEAKARSLATSIDPDLLAKGEFALMLSANSVTSGE